jgi:hypothetical protein
VHLIFIRRGTKIAEIDAEGIAIPRIGECVYVGGKGEVARVSAVIHKIFDKDPYIELILSN